MNSIPIDSTKPRGATDPSRATITSHSIRSSPVGVSSVSQPASTFFGCVSVRIDMKPFSPASVMSATFFALARAKILRAIEDGDSIFERFLGDAERIFDPRVARPDDGDMLVLEIFGIIDLIDDVRHVGALAAHPVRIALRANGEDDVFCRVDVALGGLDRKGAFLAGHFRDLGVIRHVDFIVRGVLVPVAEDIFARAFGKNGSRSAGRAVRASRARAYPF